MAQQNLNLGVMAIAVSFAVLLNCLVPTRSTGGSNGARFTVSLPLAFATFICGNALTLFSLPRNVISGGQRVASRCLAVGCVSLVTLTSLSLLWALPCKHYPYVGQAVAVVVILLVVAPMKWRHCTEGDDEAAAYEEDKDDLKDAFKTASGVTIIAVGCLLGAVFSASDHSGTSPETKTAVLFTFCTAILGKFLTVLSKTKVLHINDRRRRRGIIRAIRFGNAVLLCFLSLAAFAVLRYGVFAAFAPPAVLYFLLQRCAMRGRAGRGIGREYQEAQLKSMANVAIKLTAVTWGGIMSARWGWSLGDGGDGKEGALNITMIALASSMIVSVVGFMLMTAVPGSPRARSS